MGRATGHSNVCNTSITTCYLVVVVVVGVPPLLYITSEIMNDHNERLKARKAELVNFLWWKVLVRQLLSKTICCICARLLSP